MRGRERERVRERQMSDFRKEGRSYRLDDYISLSKKQKKLRNGFFKLSEKVQ